MALLIQEPESGQENKQEQEIVIGIDLGTTNSLVAIIENNKPRFFCDENKKELHSSVVSFDNDGKILEVGNRALENTNAIRISSIKRLMGKNFDDIKNIKDQFDFTFDENSKDSLKIIVKNNAYSSEEISAEILKYIKNLAENSLKTEIKKAVITVPAYFDEAAKNATKLAANLAGLEVLRLVNEPTAAALAYGLDNGSEGIYCIYDLGGGTFDVSILKMQKGVFKVLGVSGDNALGGDDFDDLIAKKLNISKIAARKIKEELSTKHEAQNTEFTRQEFENLIKNHINKTIKLTNNLIDDLDLEIDEIKGVVLVGGSTRIPLVRSKLAEIFGDNKVLTNLDPDRVVAIGAAWQADNLSGKSNNLLLDVIPLSLGIEMMGGIVDKVIYRNNTVPTSITKEFTTYADGQNGMQLHIVQGERELAEDCRSLARFEIKNIPAMKAGFARVAITFKVDADGLLTVLAEEKLTGEKQEIIVKPTYGLSEENIKKLLLESQENAKSDIEKRLLAKAVLDAKQDITILQNDLKNFKDLISKEEKNKIEQAILSLEELFKKQNNRKEITAAIHELEQVAENFILQKVNSIVNKNLAGKKV
ncbi:MAG: Fe-S protein assembly chaperone HscA [Rickettsiales bacterium]|nr:Fe-S protein assembly chaperone HscA [Rickettsiales bacterium]